MIKTKRILFALLLAVLSTSFFGCNDKEKIIKNNNNKNLYENYNQNEKDLINKVESLEVELNKAKEEISKQDKLLENSYILINPETCNEKECLLTGYNPNYNQYGDGYMMGLVQIEGYYKKVQKSAWGETEICDTFTVTKNQEKLIVPGSGEDLSDDSKLDNYSINLNLSNLTEEEQKLIYSSNQNNPLNLTVVRRLEPGRGVNACYSLYRVLRIEK